MTLALHPDVAPAAYDFLRTTRPFRSWRLPDSDDIAFRVSGHKDRFGEYACEGGKHTITISCELVGHTATLLVTIAHEMVHLRQVILGRDPLHDAEFKRLCKLVCRHHGWDEKAF